MIRWNKHIGRVIAVCTCAMTLSNCTESPISEGGISPEGRKIRGLINVQGYNDEDVYVWLEGFNLGTRSDKIGRFTLTIPAGSGSITGVLKLYFYVANYNIETINVVVRDGLVIYGEGDVGPDGSLFEDITLAKLLNIHTIVAPWYTKYNFDHPIDVLVTLQAIADPVTVVYPKSIGGLLGGILFRQLDSDNVYIDVPDEGAKTFDVDVITMQPKSRRMIFKLSGWGNRDLYLPAGMYEVIPYLLIQHDNLPQELLETMGQDVEKIGPDFLKIPFRRDGGVFRIRDTQGT